MNYRTMVTPNILFSHLDDPDWVIVDCRFDVLDPEWGHEEFLEIHIPGAIYAHLDKDLSGQRTVSNGRHPLPDPKIFVAKLSAWGIDETKQVVVYDTVGGAFASHLWWLLKAYGHKNVAVLDGGLSKWINEKHPTKSGLEQNISGNFKGILDTNQYVTTGFVLDHLNSKNMVLIDARSQERYAGINEPIDPVAGHIPGAVNRFHGLNLNPDLSMKPREVLLHEFKELLGEIPANQAVVYCGSGVTSCHHLLAMEYAGLKGANLYLGSWSEWIRDPDRPIIKFEGPE